MTSKKNENFLRLLETAQKDESYRALVEEIAALEPRVREVLEGLLAEQRKIVGDYLGAVGEAGRYMTLLACEKMEFTQ